MTQYKKTFSAILCVLTLLVSSSSLLAQERPRERTRAAEPLHGPPVQGVHHAPPHPIHSIRAIGADGQGSDHTFVFVSGEMSFESKIVKGAPYSAQAVTESIQTLADGNRIVHRNTATVYRDSEGRTRREQALKVIGSYTAASEPPQTVFINDPVAGVSYTLNVRERTAFKIPRETVSVSGNEDRIVHKRETFESTVRVLPRSVPPGIRSGGGVFVAPSHAPGAVIAYGTPKHSMEPKTESIGKQVIEGVEAEGTRTTITIAAGEIGNERPIEIISERWFSPELQTLVMSRHSDPRTGESTYRLTGISRDEPARSLFDVPADYKLEEGPATIRQRRPRTDQN